uniref:Syntaxin 6/10/61 N-terminal domain-containing protein n=1 Tax=Gasterosteus aculeatus aculeatus TaxID=481459 RepID=A0AAQ4QPL5_GASAC
MFVCYSEVQKAVNAAQSLHHRWSELLQEGGGASKEEMDWTTNELRNSLRSIEWDLEDLDETINILEKQKCSFLTLVRLVGCLLSVGFTSLNGLGANVSIIPVKQRTSEIQTVM